MSPILALLICGAFVSWLFRRAKLTRNRFSFGLVLTTVWLMILSSRPMSFWVGGGTGGNNLDGNPVDRILYFVMIVAALFVLQRRRFQWGQFIANNWVLCLFYLYLLLTVAWSEFPFVTFKRWFKEVGGLCFSMIIFSEEDDPLEALVTVFMRCAYVLLPLSVIFIKYFPEWGREYTKGGFPMATGVTDQKNSLGQIVLVFSLVIVWVLSKRSSFKWQELKESGAVWHIIVLLIGLWLLVKSDSKTALICLFVGCGIIWVKKIPLLKYRPGVVVLLCLLGGPLFLGLDAMFNLKEPILQMLGRDSSLTGRTAIWETVRANPVNPLLGEGYLMYWDRVKEVRVGDLTTSMNTAHNGYIEVYLHGGFIAIVLLSLFLITVAVRTSREFLDNDYGRLAFSFFVVILIYNFSESVFALRGPLWFAFLTICIRYPGQEHLFQSLDEEELSPLVVESQPS